jgi:menaquinone-dependent protoporphyrinogen IX oxidase
MQIAIIYDSRTGTTVKAAETMGKMMEKNGHQCRVQSLEENGANVVGQFKYRGPEPNREFASFAKSLT